MRPDDWHFSRRPPCRGQSALLDEVLSSKNIVSAWDRVRRNQGAGGVDGRSIQDLEPTFAHEWQIVSTALLEGSWQPQPVRRVTVPKPDGGFRTLGIPTVMDRVVHQAISQVLTPLWEPRFSDHSFAYRKGRGTREALESLATQAGGMHSISGAWHLDIRHFFDRVPRAQALRAVRRVADEPMLLRLVEQILTAGAFERGQVVPTPCGLPQGSPLSPLLANAVLHSFDLWLGQETPGFARYADDILVLMPARQRIEPLKPLVQAQLAQLGLELNEEKTQITSLTDMSFLGFCLWQDHTGHWRRRITPAAWAGLEAELQRRGSLLWMAYGPDPGTPGDYLQGWMSHFGCTECPQDQTRLESLRSRHTSAFEDAPNRAPRASVPYHGGGARQSAATPSFTSTRPPHFGKRSHSPPPPTPLWRQTLAVWWMRVRVGQLIRIGLDMDRRTNRLLPRPCALRVTVLGFTLRLRL